MKYWRVMLKFDGKDRAEECLRRGLIGVNFGIAEDVSKQPFSEMREFNKRFVPIYRAARPNKKPGSAISACSALWKIAQGMKNGDTVLSPDGDKYNVGKISGGYRYAEGDEFLHQRPVQWSSTPIVLADMSEHLRGSAGTRGTIIDLTSSYSGEIEQLLGNTDEDSARLAPSEGTAVFQMEKHLEEFLIHNWANTPLGREYDIYQDDESVLGHQFPTDTGPIDILAESKDGKTLLVIELKRGNAGDRAVGQVLRYMGYVKKEIATERQEVRGAIIALNDDRRIQRALDAVDNVKFYRYKVKFDLI